MIQSSFGLLDFSEASIKSICAIDPGSAQTGFLCWNGSEILAKGIVENAEMLTFLSDRAKTPGDALIVEQTVIYQRSSATVHDTILAYGRFIQQWHEYRHLPVALIPRSAVLAALLTYSL